MLTPTEASAKHLVDSRKADAIINLETRQLQTAQAASITVPLAPILRQFVSAPVSGPHLATSNIKPLPPGDPVAYTKCRSSRSDEGSTHRRDRGAA